MSKIKKSIIMVKKVITKKVIDIEESSSGSEDNEVFEKPKKTKEMNKYLKQDKKIEKEEEEDKTDNEEEEQKYTLEILPEAFTDFYETKNDSLKFEVNTKLISDYGNLKVNLSGAKRFPLILEILDEKGDVMYSKISQKETALIFETIEPKQYTLRVIYDDNGNGFWDTGDYLAKKQAEEIIYYPKQIDVRANWDVEQDFGLE
jgi:hypothetical protein